MKYNYELARTDCRFYDEEKHHCRGLNKLYCAFEEKPCSFYKPKETEADVQDEKE